MARLAFSLPIERERQLVADAVRHGHEVVSRTTGADELAYDVEASRPDVAVVLSDARYLTQRLLATCDDAGVRLVALVADDAGRRHAASLGLYETTDAAGAWPAIEPMLTPALALAPVELPRTAGTVIAVWGPSGAPGRTSIAIGLAAELAALGHRVALVDADTHGASVAPALGMLDEAPGFAAACRLAGSDSLTRAELERIAQRHETPTGSFWVLTGIGRASRWPELSGARVRATLTECRAWVDFVVVDTAASLENDEEISSDLAVPRRNASTVTAVREADELVAVGSANPVGLSRFLRSHVDLLDAAGGGAVTVVMNGVRASAIGLNPGGQVTQALSRFGGISAPVLVPHDLAAFDAAVLGGKTITDASPRSPARLAIRDLAARFSRARGDSQEGGPVEHAPRRRRRGARYRRTG